MKQKIVYLMMIKANGGLQEESALDYEKGSPIVYSIQEDMHIPQFPHHSA